MTLPIKMPDTTAGQMLDMLRRHYLPEYRPPQGIFLPEIGAPSGMRRADLIWQSFDRNGLVGHEIKVTRADLRHELDQPEKCLDWKKYCNRWWLVVPHVALLDGLEIPADWGIMLPPSGRRTRTMTVHRRAPELRPATQDPALRRINTWLFWRNHELAGIQQLHNSELQTWIRRFDTAREELEAERARFLNTQIVMGR
jgi:hypothetical protein